MKEYKAIFFDLYGTLINIHTDETKARVWRTLSRWFSDHGAKYRPRELQEKYREEIRHDEGRILLGEEGYYARTPAESGSKDRPQVVYPEADLARVIAALFRNKGVEPGEALIAETASILRREAMCHIRLYAGVHALLKGLKDAGKKVYLFSNAQRLFTMNELENLGLISAAAGKFEADHSEAQEHPEDDFEEVFEEAFGESESGESLAETVFEHSLTESSSEASLAEAAFEDSLTESGTPFAEMVSGDSLTEAAALNTSDGETSGEELPGDVFSDEERPEDVFGDEVRSGEERTEEEPFGADWWGEGGIGEIPEEAFAEEELFEEEGGDTRLLEDDFTGEDFFEEDTPNEEISEEESLDDFLGEGAEEILREAFESIFAMKEAEKEELMAQEADLRKMFSEQGLFTDFWEEAPEAERAENETPSAENEENDSYDGLLSESLASEGSILEIAEKRDYFDDIFISSDYGVKKPDPLFWKAVLGQLDLDPSECLMVGNDLRCDIESAQEAGIDGFYMMSLLSPDADKERVRSGEPLPAKYVQIGTNLETVRNRILSIEQE